MDRFSQVRRLGILAVAVTSWAVAAPPPARKARRTGVGPRAAASRAARTSQPAQSAPLAAELHQRVTVTARTPRLTIDHPDPGARAFAAAALLAANPARPGMPVSIPGTPVETASGGIKAPQYFAPGVAGDHGEPIAQYVQVGDYFWQNNLSANAHGNGYSDPNLLIPAAIAGVAVDGGAFNVLEGNHAENMGMTFELNPYPRSSLALAGDALDADATAMLAWGRRGWIGAEASLGNGLLRRPQHRRQFKFNAFRQFRTGRQQITVLGIGYSGFSYIPGLVPLAEPPPGDTIDPRQKDQTSTALFAVNDASSLDRASQVRFSGFVRRYRLSLFSNFGAGLIRQSGDRWVTGGEAAYAYRPRAGLSLLVGVQDQRDAPRNLDLDRYPDPSPGADGVRVPVMANDVTIDDIAPFAALTTQIGRRWRAYLGWRHDAIGFDNVDRLHPSNLFRQWPGVNSPKFSLAFIPSPGSVLPHVAFSAAEAFYTEDPRIGTGSGPGSLVNRSHNQQVVIGKPLLGLNLNLTLGHVTSEGTLAKLDPDTGLQLNLGPSRLRFLTAAVDRHFSFGFARVSFSAADARDLLTGEPTPEAPRRILDVLGGWERLPLRLQLSSEFERVAAKPLGDGITGVPTDEWRLSCTRPLPRWHMRIGIDALAARGFTGQTTEVLGGREQAVGVRLPSSVDVFWSYSRGGL